MKTYIQALKWTTGIYHLLLLPCYYVFPSLVNLYGLPLLLLIVFHITTILLAKKRRHEYVPTVYRYYRYSSGLLSLYRHLSTYDKQPFSFY